jgi:hypothetical protein
MHGALINLGEGFAPLYALQALEPSPSHVNIDSGVLGSTSN